MCQQHPQFLTAYRLHMQRVHGPRFTISLKRSTQKSSAIHKLPADYPIFRGINSDFCRSPNIQSERRPANAASRTPFSVRTWPSKVTESEWSTISAELRSHGVSETPVIVPQ